MSEVGKISTRTTWRTSDGKSFDNPDEARAHAEELTLAAKRPTPPKKKARKKKVSKH